MKENPNRGILIGILICLILLVLGSNSSDHYYPQQFPSQIETYSNDEQIFTLGDNKIVIYSWGEFTVFEWDEESKSFKWIETFDQYELQNEIDMDSLE
ncbi:hypothetical protein [Alkalihalobacillus sp. 1P02AB]|uniref:hypothetical protein n=1 Tax=Alkalihalobacillus sp. 1P02AB TaxID=3132260 RepID=UPI0039A5FB99